jgi:hypothetical protein
MKYGRKVVGEQIRESCSVQTNPSLFCEVVYGKYVIYTGATIALLTFVCLIVVLIQYLRNLYEKYKSLSFSEIANKIPINETLKKRTSFSEFKSWYKNNKRYSIFFPSFFAISFGFWNLFFLIFLYSTLVVIFYFIFKNK